MDRYLSPCGVVWDDNILKFSIYSIKVGNIFEDFGNPKSTNLKIFENSEISNLKIFKILKISKFVNIELSKRSWTEAWRREDGGGV